MMPTKYSTPLLGLDWLEWYEAHKVYHPGIDLGTAGSSDLGNEVVSAKDGQVEYVHDSLWNSGGFGRFVIIKHFDGNYTRYGHLKDVKVKEEQKVKEGEVIGHLGGSGFAELSYSPHLHFEVFNEALANIQRGHWRSWRYYPSNQKKQWVETYYINPWEWLKTQNEKDDLATAYEWAKNVGLITASKPKDVVTVDMLCVVLDRFKEYLK